MSTVKAPWLDVFPHYREVLGNDTAEQYFGNKTISATHQMNFQSQSIGNCGLLCISNLFCQYYVNPDYWYTAVKGVPEEVKRKVLSDWGDPKSWKGVSAYSQASNYFTKNYVEVEVDFEKLKKAILKGSPAHCILMSDSINKHSPLRSSGIVLREKNVVSTASFCEWLVKNKDGYIVQSPISVNEIHRTKTDFSLIRVWIWYPEGRLAFKPNRLLGHGTISTEDEVIDNLKKGNFSSMDREKIKEYVNSWR